MKELLSFRAQETIEALFDIYHEGNIPEQEIIAEWLIPSSLILYFPCSGDALTIDVTDPHVMSVEGTSVDMGELEAEDIYNLAVEVYDHLVETEGVLVEGVQYDIISE